MNLLQITFAIFAVLAAVACILGPCLKHHEACQWFCNDTDELFDN